MTQDEEITYLKREVSELRNKIDKMENDTVCPYDCDHCHGDTCPCDRFGCAGEKL